MGGAAGLLPAPVLVSPAEGAVFDYYPRQTTLKWEPVPGASTYEVETDYFAAGKWQSELDGRTFAFTVAEPEYRFEFVGAQPGRWRVRAVTPDGQKGAQSTWRQFRYRR
jgi:hypothetical protein